MHDLVGPKNAPERVQLITRHVQALIASPDAPARLPSERQLAERFHCSRNTIREALAALAAQGVIRIRGRVGAYRQSPATASAATASRLDQALTALAVTLPSLSRLAAATTAADGVTSLETVTSNLSQALLDRNAGASYRWYVTFFVELAEIAGNGYLAGMLREIREAGGLLPPGHLSRREPMEAFFSGLVELLQALRRGDGPDAAAIAGRCVDAFTNIMRAAKPARKNAQPERHP